MTTSSITSNGRALLVKLAYSHRIVVDEHFSRWLLAQDAGRRNGLLRRMMYVKSSSIHHPGRHIVLLQDEYAAEDFQATLAATLGDAKNFCGAVHVSSTPPFLQAERDVTAKYVRYAVFLANHKPYRTIILTTNDKKPNYLTNAHFTSLRGSVVIFNQDDAVTLINSYFNDFETARSQYRELR
jgi:hypothetical protein